jgi:O-antigen/teichoic acid export membrane protein
MVSLSRHKDLLVNATSLIATTGLTSILGFAYWNVAARLFSQQAVGYGAAAVALMSLLSQIGVFGLSILLIGTLPGRTSNRAGLIWAALLASAAGSLILTVAFIFIAPYFTTHYSPFIGSPAHAALLCVAVVLTAMSAVFDSATIGLLRGGLQLARNAAFAALKLLTLIGAATLLHFTLGLQLFTSWVAAIPISLFMVAGGLWLRREHILGKPDWSVLKDFSKTLAANNWLNLAIAVPGMLIPVLVASILSPSENAGFYAAWTICGTLYLLPGHFSTALFAVASGNSQVLARKLRLSLYISLLVGIPAMAVLCFGARFILNIYGPGYSRVATVPMQLLAINFLFAIPGFFYVSVCRAKGMLTRAAKVLTVFAVITVVVSVIGCQRGGLIGMTLAGLLVTICESFVTTPAVLRAAIGQGRHRRVAEPADILAAEALNGHTRHIPDVDISRGDEVSLQERQKAGLEVLLAMSTPAPPYNVDWVRPGPTTGPIPILVQNTGPMPVLVQSRSATHRESPVAEVERLPADRPVGIRHPAG